jgi:hypothetical protein
MVKRLAWLAGLGLVSWMCGAAVYLLLGAFAAADVRGLRDWFLACEWALILYLPFFFVLYLPVFALAVRLAGSRARWWLAPLGFVAGIAPLAAMVLIWGGTLPGSLVSEEAVFMYALFGIPGAVAAAGYLASPRALRRTG